MSRYDLFVEEHETAKEIVMYIRIVEELANLDEGGMRGEM